MGCYTKKTIKTGILRGKNMSETKYVTYEMFEQYHKNLMEYIGMHDDLMLNGETTCPKCGATIASDKCENCSAEKAEG